MERRPLPLLPILLGFFLGIITGVGAIWWIREPPAAAAEGTVSGDAMKQGESAVRAVTLSRGEGDGETGGPVREKGLLRFFSRVEASKDEVPVGTVEAIRYTILEPSTQGKLAYLALLQKMTTEEAPALIDLFHELSQRGHVVNEYDKLFWERWAEIDGEAASAAMFQRDNRFRETLLSKLAISTWAKNDPDAARAWLFAQEDIPLREGMVKGLVEGWAQHDPAAAQRFLMNTDLAADQLQFGFNEVARQFQMRDGLGAVGKWYGGFAETDPDFGRVMSATTQIYTRAPLEVALAWADGLGEQNQGAVRTRTQLHDRLAEGRPDGLLKHLAVDPRAGSILGVDRLTDRAVAKWISTNPGAMASWLKENPGIPNYDLLTAPFAMRVAAQDHEAALAWAGTLRDPALRDRVVRQIGAAGGR